MAQSKRTTVWIPWTPIFSAGFGTVTQIEMWYRQIGDSYEIKGSFLVGTTAPSVGTMTLPNGASIDTAKISSTAFRQALGISHRLFVGGSGTTLNFQWVYNGTPTVLQFAANSASSLVESANLSSLVNSGDRISIAPFAIPILGLV